MAQVRPFKAVRPKDSDMASQVAALPYDVMTSDEARDMTYDKPYSFLHIDRAEIDLPKSVNVYDDMVYEKARENFRKMVEDGIFIQEEFPCFYIYRQVMEGRSQYGIVACASIDEYLSGDIKKHELTLEEKEIDRMKHVDKLDANTGPIFLTYKEKENIDRIVSDWIDSHDPIYDFNLDEDGIRHTVWIIDAGDTVDSIVKAFEAVPYLYIADGHHRNASAVRVGLKRRQEYPDADSDAEFNFYLSVIFPADQLKIFDYNRVVKDLGGLTPEKFLESLSQNFDVEIFNGASFTGPTQQHSFGMYLDKKWYVIKAQDHIINEKDCIESLDVSIMQKYILSAILGINDPRKDKRIDFVGGIRGLGELTKRVDAGDAVAFAMYPTSMDELMNVADENKIMPPKSTWFEPKLRSGLFIHLLK